MMRIEKFKQLLRERIADYASKYEETKNEMIFGALQEAKDTLEYVEKQFPFLDGQYLVDPAKVKVTVEVEGLEPGEKMRIRKVATMRDLGDGRIQAEEHLVEEWKYYMIESFFQFLVAERENVLKWHNEHHVLGAEMFIVIPSDTLF